jgi:hypothetical protein
VPGLCGQDRQGRNAGRIRRHQGRAA